MSSPSKECVCLCVFECVCGKWEAGEEVFFLHKEHRVWGPRTQVRPPAHTHMCN